MSFQTLGKESFDATKGIGKGLVYEVVDTVKTGATLLIHPIDSAGAVRANLEDLSKHPINTVKGVAANIIGAGREVYSEAGAGNYEKAGEMMAPAVGMALTLGASAVKDGVKEMAKDVGREVSKEVVKKSIDEQKNVGKTGNKTPVGPK